VEWLVFVACNLACGTPVALDDAMIILLSSDAMASRTGVRDAVLDRRLGHVVGTIGNLAGRIGHGKPRGGQGAANPLRTVG